MRFLIIAIDHGWQMVPNGLQLNQWPPERAQLRALILQTIASHEVGLICEESDPCRLSIAQTLAYENIPRILWKNMNMTAQQRIEAGIYEALLNRPSHTIEVTPGFYRAVDHRIPEDGVREQFFCHEIMQAAKPNGSQNVLVLCGDMHMDFLRVLLEKDGYKTRTNRNLIKGKFWQ